MATPLRTNTPCWHRPRLNGRRQTRPAWPSRASSRIHPRSTPVRVVGNNTGDQFGELFFEAFLRRGISLGVHGGAPSARTGWVRAAAARCRFQYRASAAVCQVGAFDPCSAITEE
jgi:hypothetical protein